MVMAAQRQIDHDRAFRDNLGATAKAGQIVTDIAVVLLDGEGQVFPGQELIFRDQTMTAFPIVGQERVAGEAECIEKLLTGCLITPTQKPGKSSPLDRIKRAPKPYVVCLFLIK